MEARERGRQGEPQTDESSSGLSRLLTPAEVSALLGVSKQTLAQWRSSRRYQLAWIRVGRSCMYRPEDVRAFIEARRFSPGQPDGSSV